MLCFIYITLGICGTERGEPSEEEAAGVTCWLYQEIHVMNKFVILCAWLLISPRPGIVGC